jgi:hypothetical protein
LSDSAHDAVVFVRVNYADLSYTDCTATLLSPHVALTAKHCVTRLTPGPFVCSGNGELVQDGTGAGVLGATVDPSLIEIHVGVSPSDTIAARATTVLATQSNDACHDDLAALVLDDAPPVPSYPAIRRVKPTHIGEKVRLAGYGVGERRVTLERRELPDVRVVDSADDATGNEAAATTPRRTFVVEGNSVCFGDSGGPAFSMDTQALVGVYSRVSGDCFAVGSRNTYMLAADFDTLLDNAFTTAGEQPTTEDVPAAPAPTTSAEPATTSPEAARAPSSSCAFDARATPTRSSPFVAALLLLAALSLRCRRRPCAF